MRTHAKTSPAARTTSLLVCGLAVLAWNPAQAQQFNSDNYLSKPAGVATIILTAGQQSDMVMTTTFSLLPRWEFTYAAYIINGDNDRSTDDGYSTSLYFKYMIYENAAKTGGVAFKGGTGLDPGYLTSVGLEDAFQTWWVNAPVTFPFLNNRLSWDLMPGASYTNNRGSSAEVGWAFTYSTRLGSVPRAPRQRSWERCSAASVRSGHQPNTRSGCVGSRTSTPRSPSPTARNSPAAWGRACRRA